MATSKQQKLVAWQLELRDRVGEWVAYLQRTAADATEAARLLRAYQVMQDLEVHAYLLDGGTPDPVTRRRNKRT